MMDLKITQEQNFILISSKQLTPALFNSLRRVIISHTEILGFEEYIHPADYALLNAVFNLSISKKRHTVLQNNTPFSIPMMAHRLSRLPIFTSAETRALLKDVFFTLADATDIRKPLVNLSNTEMTISARNLTPVAVLDGQYDPVRSKYLATRMETIFPLNTFILKLYPGQKIQCIIKPVLGMGIDNPRYSPCVQRYRFNRDPIWQETHPIKEIIHKKKGELSLRKQFSTKPPSKCVPGASDTYDVFMKPYEVELMVVQNGKMHQRDALLTAIAYLKERVIHFGALRHMGDTYIQYVKNAELNLVTLRIPQDTYSDAALDPTNRIYTGHTIANLLVSKMLQIIKDKVIRDDVALLSHVLIAYKVPHPLIQQVEYTIQLPENHPVFRAYFTTPDDMANELLYQAIACITDELDHMTALISRADCLNK